LKNVFAHIELNTDDAKAAKKFYRSLFAWKLEDVATGSGTYTMIDTGSRASGGGIQLKPMPEAATAWMPYVEVADVKKSLGKAKKLGARIVLACTKLPGMGSIGVLLDPTGASLGVWQKEKAKPKKKAKRARR